MSIVIRPFIASISDSTDCSVFSSSALVGSSRMSSAGRLKRARASASRCCSPPGKSAAAIANDRVESLGQGLYEGCCARGTQRLTNLVFRRGRVCNEQIGANCVVEQEGDLGDVSDRASPRCYRGIDQFPIVDENRPSIRPEKTRKQIKECALAGPRGTGQHRKAIGRQVQIDIAQRFRTVAVMCKADVFNANACFKVREGHRVSTAFFGCFTPLQEIENGVSRRGCVQDLLCGLLQSLNQRQQPVKNQGEDQHLGHRKAREFLR